MLEFDKLYVFRGNVWVGSGLVYIDMQDHVTRIMHITGIVELPYVYRSHVG